MIESYPLFEQLTDEQKAWIEERPPVVREVAKRLPPTHKYQLGTHVVVLYSYDEQEDGLVTLTVAVLDRYNEGLAFERRVFGIKPEDLTPLGLR